jgi:hypothetical protein
VVKPESKAEERFDTFKQMAVMLSPQAFAPNDAFGCTLT